MPYSISVLIDTDDDAEIKFEGKSYCFYADDLRVSRTFYTVEECYAFLRTKIQITPGCKVSECLADWIEEFITYHKTGKDWYGVHGNQTVEISITPVTRPQTPTSNEPRTMKKIVKLLEKLARYLEDCDGVSHKADDIHDIIDAFKIQCGMPRSRVVSGFLTARDAKWCVLVNVCPDGMVDVFDHSEVGEEMIPRFHAGDYARDYVDMPMRDIVERVTLKMNERLGLIAAKS